MSNYNSQLQSNNTDLQTVLQTLQTKAAGGEQATPVITVNPTTGIITATAGTKYSTRQLAFQTAKTITPGTESQIALSSGYYAIGNITVAGDANLVASNIKNGVSIFGISGNYEGSGGDTSAEDSILDRTISSYTNDSVTSIGNYAFYSCTSLTTVSFPKVTSISNYAFYSCTSLTTVSFPAAISIGYSTFYNCMNLTTANFPVATTISNYAFCSCKRLTTANFPAATSIGNSIFYNCTNLTTANFPAATSIGNSMFYSCTSLTTVSFPKVTSIGNYAFFSCTSLTTVSFPKVTSIGNYAFFSCYNLKSLYLTGSSLCKLSHSNALTTTPIGGYLTYADTYGSIYVPASLLASYKAATNWTYFSSRFVGI